MRGWLRWMVALAVGCGPTTGTSDGGGEGGGGSTGDATTGGDESVGQSGSGGGEGDTSGGEDSSSGAVGTTGEIGPCLLAIRIDLCCNQPQPATPEDVEADTCLVAWPPDDVPDDVWQTCIQAQPEGCQVVDCDYASPPSEELTLSGEGECIFVCPEGESIGYIEPGCDFPPPIGACLPPPPPCAMDYCSCEGENVIGCGQVGEPYAHEGVCE